MAGSVVAVMGEKILRENKIPPFRGGMVVFGDRFSGKKIYL